MDETAAQSRWRRAATSWALGGAAIVLILLGTGYAFWSTARTLETLRWVDHTRMVRAELERALAAVVHVQSAVRGFQLTGREEMTEGIETSEATAREALAALGELIRDNPAQGARLEKLVPLVDAKLAFLRDTFRLRREEGADAAIATFRSLKGERLMDELGAVVREMEATEDELLRERSQAAQGASDMTFMVVAVGSGTVMVLMALAMWTIRRELGVRRQAAEVQARALAYAESIVDTVRQPLLVLSADMQVERANRSFYQFFVRRRRRPNSGRWLNWATESGGLLN